MRINMTMILMTIFLLKVSASGSYAQKITLSQQNASLKQVFAEIEKQTGFTVLYKSAQIKHAKPVTLRLSDVPLDEAMQKILEGQNLDFSIDDKAVVIKEKEKPSPGPMNYLFSNNGRQAKPVQQTYIRGTVTDTAGAPLTGVAVTVKGTKNGTQSDTEGNFTLAVSDKNAVLIFSYLGFVGQEIPAAGRSAIQVMLQEDNASLDEVVVVGYGTQEKKHLTGAIGSINMEDVNRPMGDFGQAMYGKVPGVRIQNGSGAPGASSRIQIRGFTSLTGSSAPLIVIDGVPMPTIDLNNINSNDIKSIDILKDAASAAIYGSRGAKGVILVTTKKGSAGEPAIAFNYTFSLQDQMNKVDMMSGPQYARAAIESAQNGWVDSGGDPNAPNTIAARGAYRYTWPEALEHPETLWDTDWEDIYMRVAPMSKYDLSASGGNEKSMYYLSAGVLNQEGMVVTSGYNRYTLNLNSSTKLKNWFTVGGMANVAYDMENALGEEGVRNIFEYPKIYPEFAPNGYLGGPSSIDGFANHYNILYRALEAPYAAIYGVKDRRHKATVIGNFYAEVNLLPGLKFRSSFNPSYERRDSRYQELTDIRLPDPVRGLVRSTMGNTMNYTFENLLSYDNSWADHNISAVAGYEYNQRDFYSLLGERTDYDNDQIPYLTGGATIGDASDEAYRYALMSVFGRVNYNYKGKYLASVTVRNDGSSRFGPENKWGNFPSFSAGWILSEEKFLKEAAWISNLKLRASYGLTGNDGFPDYSWISRMQLAPVAIGNTATTSYYPTNIENEDLAWERTKQYNFGLELGFLRNRFTLEADYFQSVSDGLLLQVPVPTTTGFGSVFQNIGELKSHGVELSVSSRNLEGKNGGLTWITQATFANNRSRITKLGPNNAPITLTESNMDLRNAFGEVPFSFYAYAYDGVYMNQAEIDAHGVEYSFPVHPGDGRYKDINGDGRITADDRTIIGNNQPDFIWGLNNNFTYKNLDLSFQLGGQVGGEIYNAHSRRSIFNHEGRNYFEVLENRWRSEEEPGDGYHYKLNVDLFGMEKQPSDYWLVSATYLRLRDLTLGYTFTDGFVRKIGVSGIRLYFNGVNLFHWQKAETISDPENSHGENSNPAVAGVQWSAYPTPSIYSFGLNLKF